MVVQVIVNTIKLVWRPGLIPRTTRRQSAVLEETLVSVEFLVRIVIWVLLIVKTFVKYLKTSYKRARKEPLVI